MTAPHLSDDDRDGAVESASPPTTHVSPMMWLSFMIVGTLSIALPSPSPMWSHFTVEGMLTERALDEVSGLAFSHAYPGHVWAHNDSSDRARLFLLGPGGKLVAVVPLEGVMAFDVEDIARGPCQAGQPQQCIFLGDFGDNRHRRPYVEIHRFAEPTSREALHTTLHPDLTIQLTHPDGPHDVEAMWIDPTTAALHVIEKSRHGPSRVLRVPQEVLARTGGVVRAVFEPLVTITLSHRSRSGTLITAADASPDGRCVAVRTYLELLTYCAKPGEPLITAFDHAPDVATPPGMLQSEAIAYDPADGSLLITSEGWLAPLVRAHPAR